MSVLSNAHITTVLVTTDLARSKDFYQHKLGLTLKGTIPEVGMTFEGADGTDLFIYLRPEGTKAEHTVAGFTVSDLAACIQELKSIGVTFEDYDIPEKGIKTDENHIASFGEYLTSWFTDPDGNILALDQKTS